MNKRYTWLLSRKHWLVLALCSIPLLAFGLWLLTFRTVALIFFVLVWISQVALGIGAGWAAVRLWYFRHHPLIRWVGVYMSAFIVDVISAIVLLFVARGVVLTWKFSAVMFVSALVCNILRAPLIFYLIRGPEALPLPESERSGEKPPEFWLNSFRQIVREEDEAMAEKIIKRLRPRRSKAGSVSRKRRQ